MFLGALAVRDYMFVLPADATAYRCVTVAAWTGVTASIVLGVVEYRVSRRSS